MEALAPIGVSTYGRLNHLKQTIEALKRNVLAEDSELYIFSDAPRPGDEGKVSAVRQYAHSIDGFKRVHVLERAANNRIANNRGGMEYLLDIFGKVIFLEEDVVTAEGFLVFMNKALNQYASDDSIFSITGYSPPIPIPVDYLSQIFLLRRFNAWGFGIWIDRFYKIKYLSPNDFFGMYCDHALRKSFVDGGGEDMLPMLYLDARGSIDALDVKAMYAQFISNQYTVYPVKALTSNIGNDGSGLHCANSVKFNVELSDSLDFFLPEHIACDEEILSSNRNFRRLTSRGRLGLFVRSIPFRFLNAFGK